MCTLIRYPIVHVDHHATFHVQLGPSFFLSISKAQTSWTSGILSKASASPVDAHSPRGSLARLHPDRGETPAAEAGTFPRLLAEISSG